MDIKDMEFFRLEDRMLFEAAAAANIVAAADAAQNAGDDGNNDEEKNNTDLNVALFVAPEAQNDNDAANANVANATDIDAQAKALVEGELPTMDDSTSIIPVADANTNVDADADAQIDAHHDFVEGTLHADNADTFTIDADADADHDILGNWLTNDDTDGTTDTLSVDGTVAAIAAEHTVIDIDADADADADADMDSDDFDADTRGGNHELSLDFTAHKIYDGTIDVEDGELEMNATLDGISLHVSGVFDNDSWTFNFTDDASNSYVVTVQDVVFDGKDVSTDSITIGTFSIDGDSLSDIDIIVNGEELLNTRAGEGLRADGVIDQCEITIAVRDATMNYGDKESNLRNQYDIIKGKLLNDDFIAPHYTLAEYLNEYRTAVDSDGNGGNIQYSPTAYKDAISIDVKIIDQDGHTVTNNYSINTVSGSLTVNQRLLSVSIQNITLEYGDDLGDTPDYGTNEDGTPKQGYSYDTVNGLIAGDHFNMTMKFDMEAIEAQAMRTSSGNIQSGLYSFAIVHDQVSLDNASNYKIDWNTGSLIIAPKKIFVDYIIKDKEYDGNTIATRDTNAGFILSDDIIDGDIVKLFDTEVQYTFATPDVGTDIEVTATDNFIAVGKDALNYDFNFNLITKADINPKDVEITFSALNKIYDGNTAATLDNVQITGLIADGDVTIDATAMSYDFDNKDVGTDKTVIAEGYSKELLGGARLSNYNVTFVNTALANITPLAITIGFTASDKIYDGNTTAGRETLVLDQVLEGDDVSFDDTGIIYNFSDKNVGTDKTVTATGFDAATMLSGDNLQNYIIKFNDSALANITPLPISIGFTANDKVYDGTTTATRDKLVMDQVLEGDDVSFDDSGIEYNFDTKEPGQGKTVTATGFDAATMLSGADLDNYDISFVDTTTASITYLAITIKADDKSMIYGDEEPSLTYTYEGALADGHMLSVALDLHIDEGSVTGSGHIKAGSYTDSITAVATIYDEDGAVVTGDYDITYDFGDLTVDLRNITVTAAGQSMTYGDDMPGLGQDGAYSFDPNALASGDTLTVTLEYDIKDDDLSSSGNVAAGLHTHAIVESSHTLANGENYNYTFNDASLDVTPREVTVTFGAADKTYDGNADATREGAFEIEGFVDGDVVRVFDADVSYAFSDKNVGTDKTVTATGDLTYVGDDMDNYSFIFDNTAEADITPLHIIVTANDLSMIYGDEVPSLTYTFTDDLAGDDMISITLSLNVSDEAYTDSGHIKAGEYADAITGTAVIYDDEGILVTNNYEIEFVFGKLTVDLRNITVTAKPQEMIYGDDMPDLDGQYSFDENALASGDSLAVTLFYDIDPNQDISSSGNVVAGLHSSMVNEESHDLSNAENYNYTFNVASLNVLPKDIIVSFAAADKTYDGNTDASRDGDFIIDGFINGDQIKVFDTEVTYAFDAPTVLRDTDGTVLDRTVTANGEFIAIGKDVDNYNINFVDTAEAKITPLALTVTAISQSMTYGDENPDLTAQYTVEGLLDIDTLDVALDYDFNNIATSASGHFKAGKHEDAIIEASHTLSNEGSYDYTFIAADLTVGKRPITVAADDQEITYGDEVGELTYVTTGELADGDSIDDTTLKIDGKENANGHYNAGKYDIIIDELSIDANDYDITYDPGTLLVNQKEIIITADDKTKQERDPDPRFTYTVDGLLDNDKVVGRLTRRPGEAPGEYEIRQGTLVATGNYTITYIPGTLTITENPEEPEETPPPSPRNIYQEPEQSNRNYNGPSEFEVTDYSPVIPDIHPKWDFRSRFDAHRINPLANSQDLWMDIDSLDTILVSKVISASNSANERGFSSGNEMFPNDTQTDILNVHPSDDFDSPLIDYIDVHGSNDNDTPWIFIDESIQIPKFLELDIADDTTEDTDMLGMLAGIDLNEPSKHAAFKSEVELLLDGLMA